MYIYIYGSDQVSAMNLSPHPQITWGGGGGKEEKTKEKKCVIYFGMSVLRRRHFKPKSLKRQDNFYPLCHNFDIQFSGG